MMTDVRTTRIVSLGGGVQSSVMTLMADRGLLAGGEVPDAAIWADTGWDPPAVRRTVEWLKTAVSFPVMIVSAGSLRDNTAAGVNRSGNYGFTEIPAFTLSPDGKKGMGRRQCTNQYKLRPILAEARRLAGLKPRQQAAARGVHIEQWIGISWDEVHRMKQAPEPWLTTRWPLIDARLTRDDCRRWWTENAPPEAPRLGRSACVGCPYHTSAEWVDIAASTPDLLEDAAQVEDSMRARNPGQFMHHRRIPLREAVAADAAALRTGSATAALADDGSCDSGVCFV